MMELNEVVGFLTKCGYTDTEPKNHHRVFYEFNKLDFLYQEVAKKFDFDYNDNGVEEITMTQFWFNRTDFKTITTLEELYDSI